jgi:hypothetical protein
MEVLEEAQQVQVDALATLLVAVASREAPHRHH